VHLPPSVWLAIVVTPFVPILALLTALLERSGPIRMRHWVEESGGNLRRLYERPARFAVFRFLLNLLAKLAPLTLFAAIARSLEHFDVAWAFLGAGAAVAVVLALGELASRSVLGRDPEEALRRLTTLYRLAYGLLAPLLVLLAPLILRDLPPEESEAHEEEASEEEVEAFIDVGTREGILEPEDRDLVWGVVDFGDTQVRSVMTPRVDVVAGRLDEPVDALLERMVTRSVSRMPIFRDSIDQMIGILSLRDLLAGSRRQPPAEVGDLVKPAMLVPETKLLGDLLREMQGRRQQMAIVINEHGGTEGVVTVEDLVEEIVGEIQDEYDEAEPENRLLEDGSLILDGRASLEALDEFFDWHPEESSTETVGGLVSGLVGYMPRPGESIVHEGLQFEVQKSDERRILSLRVRRLDPQAEADV